MREATQELLASQSHMDIIHSPRNYTKNQNNLMMGVVAYLWGPHRTDVFIAANELTENIEMLEEVAPGELDSLSCEARQALRDYTKVKKGILEDVRRQGKGYELFAIWLDAIHAFADYTG